MTRCLHIVGIVGFSAIGAGVSGEAQLRAGRRGDSGLIVMTVGLLQHSAAVLAGLILSAGGGVTWLVALGRKGLQIMIVAADAVVIHETLAVAGGGNELRAGIPFMAQSIHIVALIAVAAGRTGIGGIALFGADGLRHRGNVVVA